MKISYLMNLIGIFCVAIIFAAAATAAPTAFVATTGSDANPCTRTLPCRTYTAAVASVDAGGHITVLDSGQYDPVLISKSVTIAASDGIIATTASSSGNAITVAAGGSDLVVLRGLALTGMNNVGINFDSGAALYVDSCTISNFFRGILFDAPGDLTVERSVLRNNFVGIFTETVKGSIFASVDRTQVSGGSNGVYISGNTRAVVTNSGSSNNTFDGFSVTRNGRLTIEQSTAAGNGRDGFSANGGATAVLLVNDSIATGNANAGIIAGGGSGIVVRVAGSTSADNGIGFAQSNQSLFESYGNNLTRGNTVANTSGVITRVATN